MAKAAHKIQDKMDRLLQRVLDVPKKIKQKLEQRREKAQRKQHKHRAQSQASNHTTSPTSSLSYSHSTLTVHTSSSPYHTPHQTPPPSPSPTLSRIPHIYHGTITSTSTLSQVASLSSSQPISPPPAHQLPLPPSSSSSHSPQYPTKTHCNHKQRESKQTVRSSQFPSLRQPRVPKRSASAPSVIPGVQVIITYESEPEEDTSELDMMT